MFSQFKSLLETLNNSPTIRRGNSLSRAELQLSTAVLLLEVATIDQNLDKKEVETLAMSLTHRFSLEDNELNELINNAVTTSKEACSLYQFTHLINCHCNDDEKYQLACELWSVAYADNVLDKYEEHIIRRIANLIHLRHSDFIKSKHYARNKASYDTS